MINVVKMIDVEIQRKRRSILIVQDYKEREIWKTIMRLFQLELLYREIHKGWLNLEQRQRADTQG